MIVRELIKALQELPEEVQDSDVAAEYTSYADIFTAYGFSSYDPQRTPDEVWFNSVRVDTKGRGKKKRHDVILY